jgi:hypothetical protein
MSSPMTPGELIRRKYGTDFKGYLAVWNRQSRRTKYYGAADLAALDEDISVPAAAADVYVALGLQAQKLGPHRRGTADTVVALPGFVADIDYADAKDSAKRYPLSQSEAREILGAFAFEPTAIVQTGNGLHVHWDLLELFKCETEPIREQAKRIWNGFQRLLSGHFLD